jgi:hypothetical protein
MEEILKSNISINSLIWLFLAAFMIHDFEEIIFVESWMRKYFHKTIIKLPNRIGSIVKEFSTVTSSQFAVAVCIEFSILLVATFLAAEYNIYIFIVSFNAILLLHVFTHLAQTIYLRMYTPGVVTGVLVTLPYSIYFFYRLINEEIVTLKEVFIYAPLGLVLLPIVLLGHKIGKWIV